MKEAVSQSLYSYWNDLRGSRLAPKRFEIEPSCIASNLPDTFILERISPAVLKFRLAGTRVCEAFGIDFRGINLLQFLDDTGAAIVGRLIELSANDGAVCVIQIEAGNGKGLSTDFELLILPLMHTRNTVDRFLGALTPVNRPDWLGVVALPNRKVVSHEIIWPDGIAPSSDAPRQEPFMPVIREARIVRSERRQFRVYDGGLSRQDTD